MRSMKVMAALTAVSLLSVAACSPKDQSSSTTSSTTTVAGVSTSYPAAPAPASKRCSVAWSHYTGWEPLGFIQDSGIAAKWGQKYGVDLKFVMLDYMPSISAYTVDTFDGVAVTNMDALTGPAAGGVDSTFLIVGDFSNGNDGVIIKGPPGSTMASLKGKQVKLVELSVSHYLLARALQKNGMSERDITTVNVSDAGILGLITASKQGDAFTTWNPMLQGSLNVPGVVKLFDSSQIPGEIIDGLVVRTETSDACKRAIAGAWYEVMGTMSAPGPDNAALVKNLAAQAGGTEAEFKSQLSTTRMFYTPAEATRFTGGVELKQTMPFVATFSFEKGLYGEHAADEKFIGIQYPDKSVWGNPNNVKLRFDNTYMNMAADGAL